MEEKIIRNIDSEFMSSYKCKRLNIANTPVSRENVKKTILEKGIKKFFDNYTLYFGILKNKINMYNIDSLGIKETTLIDDIELDPNCFDKNKIFNSEDNFVNFFMASKYDTRCDIFKKIEDYRITTGNIENGENVSIVLDTTLSFNVTDIIDAFKAKDKYPNYSGYVIIAVKNDVSNNEDDSYEAKILGVYELTDKVCLKEPENPEYCIANVLIKTNLK